MEQRTITENQRDILSIKIAEIVLSLSQDENVQCIYFGTFYDFDHPDKTYMNLHILCTSPDEFAYQSNVDDFNKINAEGNLLGDFGLQVQILLEKDKLIYYDDLFDLCESNILFDRTGEFYRLQEEINKDRALYINGKEYLNKVEVQPSIEIGVRDGMKELQRILGSDSPKMGK